jgi:hypothetical protein
VYHLYTRTPLYGYTACLVLTSLSRSACLFLVFCFILVDQIKSVPEWLFFYVSHAAAVPALWLTSYEYESVPFRFRVGNP